MDKKDFESLLKKYPDCVSDGKKLKAFLKDLFPDVPKAIVNTLTIMADDGIISEMQKAGQTPLVSARLQKKLEDDYGLSQKIIAECFSLILQESVKQTEVASGLAYDPNDFVIKEGKLIRYKGTKSSVVIPDCVTAIGKRSFKGCAGLTSITIPDNVTSIADWAFYGCTELTNITIPNSVTSIGEFAFHNTPWYKKQLDGLVNAGKFVYEYKGIMPNNTSIVLEDGTRGIAERAFYGCTGLTSITIPDSVTSIDNPAFYGCSGLTNIIVVNGNTKYHSEGNCLIETKSKTLILGCKNSVIPTDGSVTSIGHYAFFGNTGLTSITIPDSVTSIDDEAFYGCTGLTSVTIGNGVTSIGYSAFNGCSGLESITIAKGNTKYHSFGNCLIETASKTLILGCKTSVIPSDGSVTSIDDEAFYGCTGFTSITIPDSVTSIGERAFRGCTGLTSITIPDSVTSIGDSAFYNCTGLTSITIPDNVTSIGACAFDGCTGLTSVTIGNNVMSIGEMAFKGCSGLSVCNWKAVDCSTEEDNPLLFKGCGNLTTLNIGNDVRTIPDCAFSYCNGLKSVTIPNSVISIGWGAFIGCRKLTIYCEAESKPIGWSSYWNPEHRPVVWGVKK